MFYLIGLGLGHYKDITVKGLEIVKKCDRIYLEWCTSILSRSAEELEEFYGQEPIIVYRKLVEQQADVILEGADVKNVAFLVVGDPVGATTHTDLMLRAKQNNIKVEVIHNVSIIVASDSCGLYQSLFGKTISIPCWTDSWKPYRFFKKIVSNYKRNLHTLCLLNMKGKEPTLESLNKKKREYMPPLFMSVKEASLQLLEIIDNQKDNEAGITKQSLCIGLARVGNDDKKIVACSLEKMSNVDLGAPLHCMVIAAPKLHPLELEYVKKFRI